MHWEMGKKVLLESQPSLQPSTQSGLYGRVADGSISLVARHMKARMGLLKNGLSSPRDLNERQALIPRDLARGGLSSPRDLAKGGGENALCMLTHSPRDSK